jgi:FkbM family methyltransferase
MIPRRFRIIRPYLASFLHKEFDRPPLPEILNWLTQPDKEKRASRYIQERTDKPDFSEIRFTGFQEPFFYPSAASWIDFCQTVDEVFNPNNWHHFASEKTPIDSSDIVVDCGAAEGLFAFFASKHAKKVYAIEPIPLWHRAMEKTFHSLPNVELMKVGVGHANATMRMTDNEIYSRISSTGTLEIPVCTLDSLFADKSIPVTYLKADIEGFEFQMLLGAEKLIRNNRPKISMTMYHGTNHFVEAREFLLNIHGDYRFHLRGMAENGHPVLMQAF